MVTAGLLAHLIRSMKVELERRPDGIGVRFCPGAPPRPLLDSFKRAVGPRGRWYDAAAGQWVVKESYHSWVLLWAAQARREFDATFDDRLRDQTARQPRPRTVGQAAASLPVPRWRAPARQRNTPAA